MQLFAKDDKGNIFEAPKALKQTDYFCLECGGIVRLRSGDFRQLHFYHLTRSPECRQSGKSLTHLQIQLRLRSLLPKGDVELEKRFPNIARIADVVWPSQNLVFEIQCSPIKAAEVENRNRDYLNENCRVVWILHDQQFNQNRVTAAEKWLKGSPHYYTNINQHGDGLIYDQWQWLLKGRCMAKSPRTAVSISHPIQKSTLAQSPLLPPLFNKRFQAWHLFFEGDLIHTLSTGNDPLLTAYFEKEYGKDIIEKPKQNWLWSILAGFKKVYRALFQLLLEKACR